MGKKSKPSTAKLVKTDYQLTKAELADESNIDIFRDTVEKRMDFLGKPLSKTVNIRWIDKPRSRRK